MKSGDIVIPYYDTMCRSMTPADIGGLVLVTSAILIPRPVINNVCLFPGDAANDGWLYQDYLTMTNKWSGGWGKLNIFIFSCNYFHIFPFTTCTYGIGPQFLANFLSIVARAVKHSKRVELRDLHNFHLKVFRTFWGHGKRHDLGRTWDTQSSEWSHNWLSIHRGVFALRRDNWIVFWIFA